VLVVDDEKDFATAIVERLRRCGMLADAVFGGREALESVSKNEYDAVALDLKMPGMDGLGTLCSIRQMDPLIPVLVLTGHGTFSAGIDGM
jgi:CheY-like chemotaxis protein